MPTTRRQSREAGIQLPDRPPSPPRTTRKRQRPRSGSDAPLTANTPSGDDDPPSGAPQPGRNTSTSDSPRPTKTAKLDNSVLSTANLLGANEPNSRTADAHKADEPAPNQSDENEPSSPQGATHAPLLGTTRQVANDDMDTTGQHLAGGTSKRPGEGLEAENPATPTTLAEAAVAAPSVQDTMHSQDTALPNDGISPRESGGAGSTTPSQPAEAASSQHPPPGDGSQDSQGPQASVLGSSPAAQEPAELISLLPYAAAPAPPRTLIGKRKAMVEQYPFSPCFNLAGSRGMVPPHKRRYLSKANKKQREEAEANSKLMNPRERPTARWGLVPPGPAAKTAEQKALEDIKSD
ncbi:hypothetical protein OQA88_11295 [Cercophora sp. LCS_1]